MTLRDLVAWSFAGAPSHRRAAALAAVCTSCFDDDDALALLVEYLHPDSGVTVEALRDQADRALEAAGRAGIAALGWNAPAYPAALRFTDAAPPVLWIKGDPVALEPTCVALVGSRAASPYGLEVADRLARDLAGFGLTIVSGLARGCDAAAHAGAIAGGGRTAAVLGCGADRIYPAEHRALACRILESGGLILSELPPGTAPLPSHFPRRNRIISGVSRAVVVVEASDKSGSLITATCALDQGRDVLAVPGNVLACRSRGCHALLRDGARLVESAADVLDELGLATPRASGRRPDSTDPITRQIPAGEGITVDELVVRTGLAAPQLLPRLLDLELSGRLRRTPGGRFVRLSR